MSKKKIASLTTLISLALTTGVYAAEIDNYQMPDVVVTANGYENNAKNAPASITVITKEEINKKGTTDLRDVLRDVEGVDVLGSPSRMGVANVSIRGMGSDYTLLMIDGIPLNSSSDSSLGPNGFNAELSSFIPPMSSVERIEIVRGPMSTLYGSDALGGVVNIITKKDEDDFHGELKLDHTFETEKDRGNTTRTSAFLTGPIVKDKSSFQLRWSYINRKNSTDADGKTYDGANITPSGASNYSLGGRFAWKANKDNYYYIDLDQARVDYSDSGANNPGFRFDRDRYVFKGVNVTKNGQFEYDFSNQKTVLHNWGSLSNTQDKYKTMEGTNTIFDLKYTTSNLGKHKLITGLKLWRESVDLDTLRVQGVKGKLSAFNKAFFINDSWKMGKKLTFDYGFRFDAPDQFGKHISPRAYLVYNADDKWIIKGGISEGYKAPSLISLQSGIVAISDSKWGRGGGVRSYYYGNPNLKPETAISKEVGFYYTGKNGLDAHLTFFDIDYKDKISTVELGNNNYQYTNTTKANSNGIELGATIPLGTKLDFLANYTFTNSKVIGGTYDGNPIDHTPRHSVNLKFNYYPDDKTNIWLGMNYRSQMPRYTDRTSNQVVIDALGKYYKPYAIFNAGISRKFTKNLEIGFSIENLFNKNFNESTVIDGTEYNHYCTPGKGGTGSYIGRRSFWLGLTYSF